MVAVDSVEQAIKIINDREKPLVMYVFTESSEVFQDISEKTSSGAVCHNDCMMHYTGEGCVCVCVCVCGWEGVRGMCVGGGGGKWGV